MSEENLAPLVCVICGRSFDTYDDFKEHDCFGGVAG